MMMGSNIQDPWSQIWCGDDGQEDYLLGKCSTRQLVLCWHSMLCRDSFWPLVVKTRGQIKGG